MSQNPCDKCGERPVRVCVTQVVDGEANERHLCEACAKAEGIQIADTDVRRVSPGEGGTIQVRLVHDAEGEEDAERSAVDEAIVEVQVRDAILASVDVKRTFAEQAARDIAKAVHLVVECLRSGRKVMLCGNGGSAAEAQHICAELVGRFTIERSALAAIALTTNTSILTSVANDYSYDDVFARQVEGLGARGDLLFAYSTSGNSRNVVNAIELAKKWGIRSIGFTGADGGVMAELCDVCIRAPSDFTPIVQECHTAAGHTICMIAEQIICGGQEPPDAGQPVPV